MNKNLKMKTNKLEEQILVKEYNTVVEKLMSEYGPEGCYEINKILDKAIQEDVLSE